MKKSLIAISALIAVGVVGLPALSSSSNCGGNSAALSYTSMIGLEIRMAIHDGQIETPVTFSSLIPPTRLQEALPFGWGVESYWVKKEIDPAGTEPIIICAQIFSNVPQPTLWNLYKKTPGFAAGFLDGSSRLLTQSEYNSLNFNDYEYVTEENIQDERPQPKLSE